MSQQLYSKTVGGNSVVRHTLAILMTVNGPVISWSRCGICVPESELSLDELAAEIVEAACVRYESGVGTTERKIKTVLGMTGKCIL